MSPPNFGGIQYLRDRWAEENFSGQRDLSSSHTYVEEGDHARPHGIAMSALSSSTGAGGPSHLRQQNFKGIHSLAPKRMSSWRDRLSKRGSLWTKGSGKSDDKLAEVGASTPFPPAQSQSPAPSDEEAGGSSDAFRKQQKTTDAKSPQWLVEIYTISWLIFFSIIGTLARLGVEAITEYPGAPVSSRVLWANVGGSFVMGFLIEDRQLFKKPMLNHHKQNKNKIESSQINTPAEAKAEHLKFKKTVPLYIGLTTGFCGSFTSFSSFMRDAFLALTNALPLPSATTPFQPSSAPIYPRNGGFSFLALIAILILHPAMSIVALKVGAQFALLTTPITPRIPANLLNKVLNPFMIFLSLGCWLGISLALTISPPYPGFETIINWRTRALIPMLFSPPGCLLRYWLSKYMNSLKPSFPWGTFTANIFATAVLGMAWDLQHASTIRSANACAVLAGVQEGFCGCLSTVSTWVVELDSSKKRRHGWIYGGISVGVGLGIMVVIMGSMGWTVGFAPAVCG